MYNLSERSIDDKKLLKKSSSTTSKLSIKKLLKDLTNNSVIELDIITQVKNLYKRNNIL